MNRPAVCILTAGMGRRMGAYGAALNKALLPVAQKAVISHIIEKFPADTEFVIAVGHLADQVKNYLLIAHPEHNFKFVPVANYNGQGSGPGLSLLTCKEFLQRPFFFVSSDTMWLDNPAFPTDRDWFGVADVAPENSRNYCNFEIDSNGRIISIRDKEAVSGSQFKAFVGLCFVHSYKTFWNGLASENLIGGERQVSNGTKALVEKASASTVRVQWIDTGDAEKYRQAVSKYENFDYSKPNEALYVINGKVIKYFADNEFAQARVARAKINPAVFPKISEEQSGFFWYPFVAGNTMYALGNPERVRSLLSWLDQHLWKKVSVPAEKVRARCDEFYHEKTLKRLAEYNKKYGASDVDSIINEERIPSIAQLVERIPWKLLSEGEATFFHGDLQFDNIVFSPDSGQFTLLDWRQDFAGETGFGDLYYDFAKLQGGLHLNYDYIKQNLFSYVDDSGSISLDFARRHQCDRYSEILKEYVNARGLDWSKVQLLVPIIYLNMSPLHHHPYDKFLHALGRKLLHAELTRLGC